MFNFLSVIEYTGYTSITNEKGAIGQLPENIFGTGFRPGYYDLQTRIVKAFGECIIAILITRSPARSVFSRYNPLNST